jgi:quinol monooxygenase YgiN
MVSTGLVIRLQAAPGRDAEVRKFLDDVIPLVNDEPGTTALLAVQFGPSEYGIINAFNDQRGLQEHFAGHAAALLSAQAAQLFAAPPAIEQITILGSKLPSQA